VPGDRRPRRKQPDTPTLPPMRSPLFTPEDKAAIAADLAVGPKYLASRLGWPYPAVAQSASRATRSRLST
jgi:hypothetical protein